MEIITQIIGYISIILQCILLYFVAPIFLVWFIYQGGIKPFFDLFRKDQKDSLSATE